MDLQGVTVNYAGAISHDVILALVARICPR